MVSWTYFLPLALVLISEKHSVTSTSMSDGSADVTISQMSQLFDDESWWDNAEEIDLTMRNELEDIMSDEGNLSNDTCLLKMDCENLELLEGPPNFIEEIPPPPLPPNWIDLEQLLEDKNSILNNHPNSRDNPEVSWWEEKKHECNLCQWATGGNETLNLLSRANNASPLKNKMAGVLVVVAVISAILGASIMGVLLKCKKIKILSVSGVTCSVLVRSWTKGITSKKSEISNVNSNQPNKPNQPSGETARTGWSMKVWRKSPSQSQLQGSENSYSEEPYVNTDGSSEMYAELDSTGRPLEHLSRNSLGLNTYSEIPDPVSPSELNICSRLCGHNNTYENAGYIMSEAISDQNESSTGSNSTPSSAYYSDVSSCEIHNSKKKKKKRKSEDRSVCKHISTPVCSSDPNIPAISGHIALHPMQLNSNGIHPRFLRNRDSFPLTLQLVPRHLNLERREVDLSMDALSKPSIYHLPDLKTLPNRTINQHLIYNHNDANCRYPNSIAVANRGMPYITTIANMMNNGNGIPTMSHTSDRSHSYETPQLQYPPTHSCLPLNPTYTSMSNATNGHEFSHNAHCPAVQCMRNLPTNTNLFSNTGMPNVNNNPMNCCTVGSNTLYEGNPDDKGFQSTNNCCKRPLPPLPSRIVAGPQKRNLQVSVEHGVPVIPSEYV